MKTSHVMILGCVAVIAVGISSLVSAQSFDHLECYAIKDTLARGTARADLVPGAPPFLAALGCKITLPAREYCTRSAKENLQPPPSSTIGGDEPGDYFCYRVACPRGADLRGAALQAEDQFGSRPILVRRPQRLCVPASRATPTPTPATTPTGTVPTVTPGGPHDPGWSFDGSECQGSCNTTGRCMWEPNQLRCICPAFFDADCNNAVVSCGGGLCFGPDQVCRPNPQAQATARLCVCAVSSPTPAPSPTP